MKEKRDPAAPLPATVKFVTVLGLFIGVGWLLMFWLLVSRW